MNTRSVSNISWFPLSLVWLAYILLGWHLSAHHIVWLVGGFIVFVVLEVIWKSISWVKAVINFGSQALIVTLVLSSSIALIAIWSVLVSLLLLPLTTTLLANIELRNSGFTQIDTILMLTFIAGLGLAVGEIIDICFHG